MSIKLNVSIAGTGTTIILFLICSIGFAPTPSGETLFADDFESGGLEKWDVVNGEWDVIDVDGNHVARLINGVDFAVINIANFAASDYTIEVRIWDVSQNQGANIYFRNNRTAANIGADSGFWFGISGALAAVGWGDTQGGLRIIQVARSPVPFTWMRLKLSLIDENALMWALREGVDDDFIQVFNISGFPTSSGSENLGLIVGGREVWVDDVLVYDQGGPTQALLLGDFDLNNEVGLSDFVLFLDAFATTASSSDWNPIFDLDDDGEVGLSDFVIFLDNFGVTG